MILLERAASARSGPRRIVAIFGVGLIGSAIANELRSRDLEREIWHPFDWEDRALQKLQMARIEREAVGKARAADSLSVIWSAGRAGFSASPEETAGELESFKIVLGMSARVAEARTPRETNFILMSSAGGLFEGQRNVTARSQPAPRRPYGELKWAEERLVKSASPTLSGSIIRLSSVFGRLRPGRRSGLIPTLVVDGIQRRVTSIVGSTDTLRDFVWVNDVANFVSRRILGPDEPSRAEEILLSSGRPTSIFEVERLVERELGHPIYISYSLKGDNRDDITFSPVLHPEGWSPRDLETNISIVYRDALSTIGERRPKSTMPGWVRRRDIESSLLFRRDNLDGNQ